MILTTTYPTASGNSVVLDCHFPLAGTSFAESPTYNLDGLGPLTLKAINLYVRGDII